MPHPALHVSPHKLATPEMSFSLGMLLMIGPLLALIWLLLPHPPVGSISTLVGVSTLSITVGCWLVLRARRPRPLWALHVLIAVAVLFVSVVVVSAGSNRGLAVFYLFVAPYAWAFFSARAAVLHTTFTAAVSLATLARQQTQFEAQPVSEAIGRWLFIVCCLVAVGLLIRSLTSSLRRAVAGQECQAEVSRVLAGFMQRALEGDALTAHFQDAVQTVQGVLGASMSSIVEKSSDATLRIATSVGSRNPVPPGTLIDDTDGLIGYAIATGGPVVCLDLTTETRFVVHRGLLEDGQRSGVMAPIQREGTIVGFLQAFSRTPGRFDAGDALTMTAFAATLSQVVHRDAVDREMAHRALHDPLTGLPNRALFADRLSHAVSRRTHHEGELAVIFADIDGFKTVNDTHGHLIGDELLVALAPRLATLMREGDTLARFGGDEFVFLLEDISSTADAMDAAHRLAGAAQNEPLTLSNGLTTRVSLSVGVSLSHARIDCVETMIAEADAAMYQAKAAGEGQVRLYDDRYVAVEQDRRLMEPQLRLALANGQLAVAYQPIVDVQTSVPVGFEALARWNHPERGLVSPQEFIAVAEDAGLIGALDELVLRTASEAGAAWQQASGRPLLVSVNVSPRHLSQPSFADTMLAIHAHSDLLPGTLYLEITETALILDTAGASAKLTALQAAGVLITLDDFGTGYSSLTHLRDFPIHTVKIDKSFVRNLLTNDDDAAIVEGVIVMARRMGLTAIAEGVESVAVHTRLRELGCPLAQGHLFSAALPGSEVGAYLSAALPVHV